MKGLVNFCLQQVERKNCLGDTRGFAKVFEKEYSSTTPILIINFARRVIIYNMQIGNGCFNLSKI
jgi:hypothetical protein